MYWPLLNMYSENFGFGLGGFIISRTFNNVTGLMGAASLEDPSDSRLLSLHGDY